jgi:hypothetical protein
MDGSTKVTDETLLMSSLEGSASISDVCCVHIDALPLTCAEFPTQSLTTTGHPAEPGLYCVTVQNKRCSAYRHVIEYAGLALSSKFTSWKSFILPGNKFSLHLST